MTDTEKPQEAVVEKPYELSYIKEAIAGKYFSHEELVSLEIMYFESRAFLTELLNEMVPKGEFINYFDIMAWIGDSEGLTEVEKIWLSITASDYLSWLQTRWGLTMCGCEACKADPQLECPYCRKRVDMKRFGFGLEPK